MPAGVLVEVLAQRVHGAPGLLGRVDRLVLHLPAGLPPRQPVVGDGAALDLQYGDAGARQRDDQVGLVVALAVDEPQVRQQRGVVRQLVAQRLPDRSLGGVLELRLRREAPRRHHTPVVTRAGRAGPDAHRGTHARHDPAASAGQADWPYAPKEAAVRPDLSELPRDPHAALAALAAALDGSGPAQLAPPADPATAGRLVAAARPGAALEHPGTALVVGTSGSSGEAKAVVLSSAALRASATATAAQVGAGRWLLALPLHHVAGLQVLVRSLLAGTSPVVADLAGGFTVDAFRRGHRPPRHRPAAHLAGPDPARPARRVPGRSGRARLVRRRARRRRRARAGPAGAGAIEAGCGSWPPTGRARPAAGASTTAGRWTVCRCGSGPTGGSGSAGRCFSAATGCART